MKKIIKLFSIILGIVILSIPTYAEIITLVSREPVLDANGKQKYEGPYDYDDDGVEETYEYLTKNTYSNGAVIEWASADTDKWVVKLDTSTNTVYYNDGTSKVYNYFVERVSKKGKLSEDEKQAARKKDNEIHQTGSGISSKFIDKSEKLKKDKYMLCSYQRKVIFSSGYTARNVSAVVATYAVKDSSGCDSYIEKSSNIKNYGVWESVNAKTRRPSIYDQIERYVGLRVSINDLKLNGTVIGQSKDTFVKEKGTYNGDSYDAKCEITDQNGVACVVLFKDIKLEKDNDCKNLSMSSFVEKMMVESSYGKPTEDGYTVDYIYQPSDESDVYYSCNVIAYLDKNYNVYYKDDDNDTCQNNICTGQMHHFDRDIEQSITMREMDSNMQGHDVTYSQTLKMNGDLLIGYGPVTMITSENGDSQIYDSVIGGDDREMFGLLLPKKVTKNGTEITPTYTLDKTPGTFKGCEYDGEFLLKDGNTIFGRLLIKNIYKQE